MPLYFCLFILSSIPSLFYHSYEENALILLINIHNYIIEENIRYKFNFYLCNYWFNFSLTLLMNLVLSAFACSHNFRTSWSDRREESIPS